YLLWLLPLFAVTGIRRNWEFKWVAFTVAFFLAFGAADQLSIHQFLELEGQMAALSMTVSWTCIALLALVDPSTRWVVWHRWQLPRLKLRWPWSSHTAEPEPPRSTSQLHTVPAENHPSHRDDDAAPDDDSPRQARGD